MLKYLALMLALVVSACSSGSDVTLAGKLHGRWVETNGSTMEFSGTTLRERVDMNGSAIDVTSTITYHEPDKYDKPGMLGAVYTWRVIFDDPDHIELIPPNYGVSPKAYYTRQ